MSPLGRRVPCPASSAFASAPLVGRSATRKRPATSTPRYRATQAVLSATGAPHTAAFPQNTWISGPFQILRRGLPPRRQGARHSGHAPQARRQRGALLYPTQQVPEGTYHSRGPLSTDSSRRPSRRSPQSKCLIKDPRSPAGNQALGHRPREARSSAWPSARGHGRALGRRAAGHGRALGRGARRSRAHAPGQAHPHTWTIPLPLPRPPSSGIRRISPADVEGLLFAADLRGR